MPTINDVARAAGVSISTVSYALSGKRPVGAATRKRVLRAVRELGYEANVGARILAGERQQIIALAMPLHEQTHPPAFMSFVLEIVRAARQSDFDVLLLTEPDPMSAIKRVVSSSLVDSVILMDVSMEDSHVRLLRELGVPAVVIGLPRDRSGLVFVDLDFEAAAELAVNRLYDLGHRTVGLVGHAEALYTRQLNYAVRFREGFDRAVAHRGIESRFAYADEAAGLLHTLRGGKNLPTAVVLDCNELGHQAFLRELGASGLLVPGDMSLISACTSFPEGQFCLPLDVIPLPVAQSSIRAVQAVVEALATGEWSPRIELIQPQFVEKGSTAAPHR